MNVGLVLRDEMIDYPITKAEVSAGHGAYRVMRRLADSLIGQPYWDVCDQLTEAGFELEYDTIEDDGETGFTVSYFQNSLETQVKGNVRVQTDSKLGTIMLYVNSVNSGEKKDANVAN